MKQLIVRTCTVVLLIGMVAGCSTSKAQREDSGATTDRGGTASLPADDATLTAKVKAKLLSDDMLNALKIDVDSQGGTVFLSGVVDTEEQKSKAVQIAKNTEGVRKVEDNLQVGRVEGSSTPKSKLVHFLEDIG